MATTWHSFTALLAMLSLGFSSAHRSLLVSPLGPSYGSRPAYGLAGPDNGPGTSCPVCTPCSTTGSPDLAGSVPNNGVGQGTANGHVDFPGLGTIGGSIGNDVNGVPSLGQSPQGNAQNGDPEQGNGVGPGSANGHIDIPGLGTISGSIGNNVNGAPGLGQPPPGNSQNGGPEQGNGVIGGYINIPGLGSIGGNIGQGAGNGGSDNGQLPCPRDIVDQTGV